MKNKFLLLFISIMHVLPVINVSAQIKYIDGRLMIGDVPGPYSYYGITANTNGIYFMGTNNRFFQLDVTAYGAPRISGHNDNVVFYNTVTSVYNAVAARQVYVYSDMRAKTNVRSFNSGIDVISRLRPVSYNFTGAQNRSAPSNQYTGDNVEIGLIAQELEKVLPNLVYTDDEGRKLVDYTSLIPVLIDAVQTLQQEVDALKVKANMK